MAKNFSVKVAIGGKLDSSLANAVRGAQSQVGSLGRHVQAMNNRMASAMQSHIATAARLAGPAALAIGGQRSIAAAADFEASLTGIRKKAGLSADATARLGQEIKTLATNGSLAVPISEIAAAYERGGAAGIALDQLREFAKLSTMAADAFDMSATDVGNAAAGFNKALGVPITSMERLFDLINGLADSGIADESGIVAFVDQAGAMAKTFGLSVDQTAALGAALANLKVPAGEGATAINSILTKLLAPQALSKDGRAAFGLLVGDTKKFAKAVEKDADGALLDLVKRLKSLDKAKRTGIIADLFGQEHLDVMTALVEGSEELERNLRYAAGHDWLGSLSKSYQLKLDNFWSRWQVAKNSLGELAIDIGDMGMPALKSGLDSARSVASEIGGELKNLRATIDLSEIMAAKTAISDLGGAIRDTLNLGGDKTPIGLFFSRISQAANTASAGINALKDAGQAIGLIAPDDDTAAQRQRRRDRLIDGTFDGPLGVVPKAVYDVTTGRFGGDYLARAGEDQARAIAQTAATRGVSIETVRAEIEAAARRRAERTGQPYRDPFPRNPFAPVNLPPLTYPTQAPVGLRGVPVPTARPIESAIEKAGRLLAPPNIVGPLEAEGAKAVQSATEIGAKINTAASITAKPVVDTSSISSAITQTNTLGNALRSLPNVSLSAPIAAPAVAGARAKGGPVRGGSTYLVGERGPELFTPPGSGNIVPHHRLADLAGKAERATVAASNRSTTFAPKVDVHVDARGRHDADDIARLAVAAFHRELRRMEADQRGLLSD